MDKQKIFVNEFIKQNVQELNDLSIKKLKTMISMIEKRNRDDEYEAIEIINKIIKSKKSGLLNQVTACT